MRQHLPIARRALLVGTAALLSEATLARTRWSEPMPLASRSLFLDGARGRDRVIMVGERGHVLVSVDRGRSWAQAKVPARTLLTAVAMVGSDLAWAVGHGPVVLHSTDGGASWTRQPLPHAVAEPLLDLWFADARRGVAVGAFGRVVTTDNGGATWRTGLIDPREPHINAIVPDSRRGLYAAAEFGMIFASTDGGRSWRKLDVPDGGSFFGILCLGRDTLLAYGLRGRLVRSVDGGLSWTAVESGSADTLLAGLLRRDGTVLLGGLRGTVLVSRDGGRTFEIRRRSARRTVSAFVDLADRGTLVLGRDGFEVIQDLGEL